MPFPRRVTTALRTGSDAAGERDSCPIGQRPNDSAPGGPRRHSDRPVRASAVPRTDSASNELPHLGYSMSRRLASPICRTSGFSDGAGLSATSIGTSTVADAISILSVSTFFLRTGLVS